MKISSAGRSTSRLRLPPVRRRRNRFWVAVCLASLAVPGCSERTKTTEEASATTSSPSAAVAAASPSPARLPIATETEFRDSIAEVRQILERGCFDPNKVTTAQCQFDAGLVSIKLMSLADRLPATRPETRAAAQEFATELERWRACFDTQPDTPQRQECIRYIPRPIQLVGIEAAWTRDKASQ